MKLIFKQSHLSIDQFDPVEMPDFVVLTGVNGSGKSHLLEAINQKHVIVDGLKCLHIVLFNYETFRMEGESWINANQLFSECESAWNILQQHSRRIYELRSHWGNNYEDFKKICRKENKSLWNLPSESLNSYKQGLVDLFTKEDVRNNQGVQGVFSLAKQLPYSIDEIERDEFLRLYKPFVFRNDFLPQQLGKVFWDYYVKYCRNQINEFLNRKYNKHHAVLSEEDFISTHGRPPWELVNGILETFDTVKYRVTSPEGHDLFGNFELKLRHIEKPNLEVSFYSLSSGEKVLMALVASVYKASADKHFPDLLLLDEIDASLHPAMMQNMLDVIDRIFLQQGVKVILVTHSPTTIALAPENSIFVMNRSGSNRIEKKSKQEALTVLTQGFATIEEGLKLFDQIAKLKLTIISEGNNTRLIKKALELNNITDVEVLNGIEAKSGQNQLKTLFQFFTKIPHQNKVLFVWDCDVTSEFTAENNTFPFIIPKNTDNTIANTGIENAFPRELFGDFCKSIKRPSGVTTYEFDKGYKREFESFLLERNNANDFSHFNSLIEEIRRVQSL